MGGNASRALLPVLVETGRRQFAAACAMLAAALCIQGPASPHRFEQEPQAKVERVDVEQVERTLQDLEMLKQLTATVSPEANSSSSM